MKIDRSIDTVNDCEPWRKIHKSRYGFVQNMTTGWSGASNSKTGVIFCPYVTNIFNPSNLYPNIIKPFNLNTNEVKTQIRYRTFKRYRAGR